MKSDGFVGHQFDSAAQAGRDPVFLWMTESRFRLAEHRFWFAEGDCLTYVLHPFLRIIFSLIVMFLVLFALDVDFPEFFLIVVAVPGLVHDRPAPHRMVTDDQVFGSVVVEEEEVFRKTKQFLLQSVAEVELR